MSAFHPDLSFVARFLPRFSIGPRLLWLARRTMRDPAPPRSTPEVRASLRQIPGAGTARVFVPTGVTGPMPALLWVHGGGFIMGSPAQDDALATTFARELGITPLARIVATVLQTFPPAASLRNHVRPERNMPLTTSTATVRWRSPPPSPAPIGSTLCKCI